MYTPEFFDAVVRGIVMTRGELGATIAELRSDYFHLVCRPWPLSTCSTLEIVRYLQQIDGLVMDRLDTGAYIWYNEGLTETTETATDADLNNNSYSIAAPPQPKMLSSSIITDYPQSAASDTLLIESIQAQEKANKRRNSAELCVPVRISPIRADHCKRRKITTQQHSPVIIDNFDNGDHDYGKSKTSMSPVDTESIKRNAKTVHEHQMVKGLLNGNASLLTSRIVHFAHDSRAINENILNCEFHQKCHIDSSSSTLSASTANNNMNNTSAPLLNGIDLMGDDFLCSLVHNEIFHDVEYTAEDVLNIGHCISGQTIREAYFKVLDNRKLFNSTDVLINLGAIDILLGRDLIEIEVDYARLISALELNKIRPIVTTLPTICANTENPKAKQIYQTQLLFNQFLIEHYSDSYLVVDLWPALTKNRGNVNKYCYQSLPSLRKVKGTTLELWLWNKYGRALIMDVIKKTIGFASSESE